MTEERRTPPTPASFSAETENALLGEYYSRKNRGRSERIATAEVAILIDCVGDDELAAGFQIACEVVPADGTVDGKIPPVVGLIEWGTDGSTETAEFDFVNGTVISVAGSSVRVKARYEMPPAADHPVPAIVRAHIGYFPKPAAPAQRTLGGLAVASASVVVSVPKFARFVRVLRAPLVSTTLTLANEAGADVGVYGPSVDPVLALPLPNDARTATLLNGGAVAANLRAVFELWI